MLAEKSPLPGKWRQVLQDIERTPYEQKELGGLWAHFLCSCHSRRKNSSPSFD